MQKIKRLVQTAGKRCFRNCYTVAARRGEDLTKRDLVACDPALRGTAETGLNARLSAIKKIFREGWQDEALNEANNAKNF